MTEVINTNNNSHGVWITRNDRKKRRMPVSTKGSDEGGGVGGVRNMTTTTSAGRIMDNNYSSVSSMTNDNKSSTNTSKIIPASLAPHLGWTKLSSSASCRRRRIRQRQQDLLRARRLMALSDLEEENEEAEDGYIKVHGRAIFFIHDPLFENSDESDDVDYGEETEEENSSVGGGKRIIWFQGRFFPSVGEGESRTNYGDSMESWGILAETGANDVDDCLLCPDGGYRILDMTFLRQSENILQGLSDEGERTDNKQKQPLPQFQFRRRWTARDLIWTGGNMMTLSTEDYSLPTSSILNKKKNQSHNTVPCVNFEPSKLVEGTLAIDLASKYFPQLVRRLQVRDIIEDGDGHGARSLGDAMVLIGDMQVSGPASFVAAPPGGRR